MSTQHDDLLFARYQGFYEYLMEGPDSGRTHPTNQDWNEAYDTGRNEAEALNTPEGDAPFAVAEIDAWMDEATYLRVSGLIADAARLFGDGEGRELGENTEYERAQAELICASAGLSSDHLDAVVNAIHATARDTNKLNAA